MPRPQVVNKTFGPLNEKIPEELNEDGLVTCTNVEFSEYPKLKKRPGMSDVVTSGFVGERLGVHKDQLVSYSPSGPALYAYQKTTESGFLVSDNTSEYRIERDAIHVDINRDTIAEAMATVQNSGVNFYVAAWVTSDYNANETVDYRVWDENGAIFKEGQLDTSGSIAAVRCEAVVAGGTSYVLIMWDNSTKLLARAVSVSVSGVTISASNQTVANPAAIITGWDVRAIRSDTLPDALTSSTHNMLLAYTESGDITVVSLRAADPSSTGSVTTVTAGGTFDDSIAIHDNGDDDRIFFVAYDSSVSEVQGWVYDVFNGVLDVDQATIQSSVSGLASGISVFSPEGQDLAWVSWTHEAQTAGKNDNKFEWCTFTTIGTVSAIGRTLRIEARSHIFTRDTSNARAFQVVAGDDAPFASGDSGAEKIGYVVELTTPSLGTNARMLGAFGYGVVAGRSTNYTLNVPHLQESASTADYWSFHHAIGLQAGGFGSRTGTAHIKLIADERRYESVEFGDSTYFASGLMLHFEGSRLYEQGFVMPARVASSPVAPDTSGGLAVYKYKLCYEYYDRYGQYHQGVPTLGVTYSVTGTGESVLTLWPSTLGLRQADEDDTPTVYLALYRARVDSGGDGVYYRQYDLDDTFGADYENKPVSPSLIVVTDTFGSDFASNHPALYTTGGALEHDSVYGGGSAIEKHKQRLWVCGGEQPDVIWYSEEILDAEPAQFNLAQQIRIPGERLNWLASLDDALIVGSLNRIYAIFGEGPNRLGDVQSGQFTSPQEIISSTGITYPRVKVRTRFGVMFAGAKGIYLLDRSRQIQHISDPIQDTLASYPVVRSGVVHSAREWVYFLLQDDADEPTDHRVAMYDLREQMWSVWQYASELGVFTDLYYHNGDMYAVNAGADLMVENTDYNDNGYWYGMTVKTGHQSFGSTQGYKEVKTLKILADREGESGGVDVTVELHGADKVSSNTYTLTDTHLSGSAKSTLIQLKEQYCERIQVTLAEKSGTASEGYTFTGHTYEVLGLPGVGPVPPHRRV